MDESRMLQLDLSTKRRRWGRFIGLRGCESPADDDQEEEEEGEELVERMETDWQNALRRAEEEERGKGKI